MQSPRGTPSWAENQGLPLKNSQSCRAAPSGVASRSQDILDLRTIKLGKPIIRIDFEPGFPIWVQVHGESGWFPAIFCPTGGLARSFSASNADFLSRRTVWKPFSDPKRLLSCLRRLDCGNRLKMNPNRSGIPEIAVQVSPQPGLKGVLGQKTASTPCGGSENRRYGPESACNAAAPKENRRKTPSDSP